MVKPHLRHYCVVGRETPSEKNPEPTVYKYEVFAPNFVVAKSRFWRMMREKNKVKSTHGDVLSCKVVRDKKLAARNYSVDIAYYSQRCGYTHMVKEFRDVCKAGAVCQAYHDLASRHRARYHNIDVLGVKSIPNHEVRRANVAQFHDSKLSFPLLQRRVKGPRKDRVIFVKKNTKRAVVA
ncbi:putative Ribosomal proteins 50S L18Ae 60S L20 60S L18A [Trypanosoma vivax]|uniref:60S ribosomal protein L18a n=1 Tax=Trypanosoma vivax (strain Y486) TaxID=1055687 RepID=G0U631_TRYVY|nr:ribosomal protein L18 [Trypanosoma vivax]KAG8347443.1 ribosomal protein L18 [Trypanosoma vivax]KAH8607948.1 putative Ribosomal proteins 50S L18Ae 60S L20 60S L18A [Trypanosoma vivax]CCC51333.1 putative 60S ribosomal protein L18a [Trypanosoma vivax Y486]CCC54013.1 putative 60S ribosomal protein L18a [Trypanosoma vivax Y486]